MQPSYQFVCFSLVGAIGTTGHYLTLLLLVSRYRVSPVEASALGSVAGAAINYMLNYKFTFRSQAAHRRSISRFMLVASAGALLNLGIMWLGVNLLNLHYIVVQLIATGLVLVFGFLLNRAWTFRAAQS